MDVELEKYKVFRFREEANFAKRAFKELGETTEKREDSLRHLKKMLDEQDEFVACTDSDYIIRFLRAKKFNVPKAFSLIRNYHRCRLICPEKFAPVGQGPRDIKHLYDLKVGTVLPYRNPIDGSIIIVAQFGNWTPESGYDLMDTYTPVRYVFDYVLNNPECQLHGFHLLFNLKGLELRYLRFLYPEVVKALITCYQDGFPARFKACHIVNNSYVWNMIWAIVRTLLKEKIRNRVHLHASNMSSLHEFISPEILPESLGGKATSDFNWFLERIYEQHDDIVRQSYQGYVTDEDGNSLEIQ